MKLKDSATIKFCNLLLEANKTQNLISKNDEKKIMTRHVADSLIFANYIENRENPRILKIGVQTTWIDIGSGAGFPVIPLCIHFPQIKFYAIEPRKKRCEFLNLVKQELNLQNFEVIQSRAETCGLRNADIVSSRAVGSFEEDFKRAKMLLKSGGHFLTVKTKRVIDENIFKNADIVPYRLEGEEMEYALVHVTIL